MLKIITNSEVYESFSESDDETDATNDKLKGIEVLRTGHSWMGVTETVGCDSNEPLGTLTYKFCSSFNGYSKYEDVIDADPANEV